MKNLRRIKLIIKSTFRERNTFLLTMTIIFSFFIPMILTAVSGSFFTAASEQADKIYGTFDNIWYQTTSGEGTLTLLNDHSSDSFSAKLDDSIDKIGKIFIYEEGEENNINFTIGYADQTAQSLGNISLSEGKLPEKEGEAAICTSLLYKLGLNKKVGDTLTINGTTYTLTGIANDYGAKWSRPSSSSEEIMSLPAILVSKNETAETQTAHLLIKNKKTFSKNVYSAYPGMAANVNRQEGDQSSQYQMPEFVYLLAAACTFLLNLYMLSYYFESLKKKIYTLRCLNMTKRQCVVYIAAKVLLISIIALPAGLLLGYLAAAGLLQIFHQFMDVDTAVSIDRSKLFLNSLLVLISILLPACVLVAKITHLAPIALLRGQEHKKRKQDKKTQGSHSMQTTPLTLPRLGVLSLKKYKVNTLLVIVLIAFSVTLFHTLSVYTEIYSANIKTGEGQIASDFDYEFTSNQELKEESYIDENGAVEYTATLPSTDSVYYLPDHRKIISKKTIKKMQNTKGVSQINNYLEVNDVYITDTTELSDSTYLTGFDTDSIPSDEISDLFHFSDGTRGIQFFGFSTLQVKELSKYVREGEIHIDKILSGEEVILMVPDYQLSTSSDGTVTKKFLSNGEYSGKSDEYRDTCFHVGDIVNIAQLTSKNENLTGYINEKQAKNNLTCTRKSAVVGAIIRQRVNWFDNLSQMPTAYSLIGTNETITNLGLLPTLSRVHIYLDTNTSYTEFDSVITSWQEELSGFNFRNNAAELHDFKQFLSFLYAICGLLAAMIAFITICIIFIEERIQLINHRKFYTLLHLIGLNYRRITHMLTFRSFLTGLSGILLSAGLTISILYALYGSFAAFTGYIQPSLVLFSILGVFIVFLFSSLASVQYLKKERDVEII